MLSMRHPEGGGVLEETGSMSNLFIPCAAAHQVYNNQLWVVGGGRGGDLLRSGPDVHDVHCLDLASLTWSKPALQGAPPSPECTGVVQEGTEQHAPSPSPSRQPRRPR